MKKIIYFTLQSGLKKIDKLSEFTAISDLNYLIALNKEFDLHIVHPTEYNFDKRTVKASYGVVIDNEKIFFPQKKGIHEPTGDLFFIYSDGCKQNPGLNFMLEQYNFLKKLKKIKYFFNQPEAEEKTLKNYLPHLSKMISGIAKTEQFNQDRFDKMISLYGSTVIKPIAGNGMKNVFLLNSKKDLTNFKKTINCSEKQLSNNYMLQEPLKGDEKRILILGNKFLGSRVHINRTNPWSNHSNQKTFIYKPTKRELEIAINITNYIGADILGIDFIGSKVNEINGSGTDIVYDDHHGKIILNKIPEVIDYLKTKFKK